MSTPEPCPTCAQPRDAHDDRCPQGEIDRLRARLGATAAALDKARERVAELEESNRAILDRKTRLADEMAASEGVSNKLVAEADDARLSAERHAAELLGAVGAWVRTASRERDRATAAEARVAAVRALLDSQPCHCQAPAQFGHRADCPRIRIHVHVIRRALDAATTPAETSPTGPPVT